MAVTPPFASTLPITAAHYLRVIFWLLCISCPIFLSAQRRDSLTLIKHIALKSKLFTTDPLGNVYLIKDNNALIRYNANGDSTGFFNLVKKGKVTHIDATNPLRVLLYFAEYGQIVILDNILSQKSSLRLPSLGLFNVPCIANSADGNIWVYDPGTGELIKIDEKPSVKFRTPLRNMLDTPLEPIYMVEQDRQFFMIDTLQGIKKFDQFGFYNTGYPFITRELQYINQYLIYYQTPYLHSYHIASMREELIPIPEPDKVLQVRIERHHLYILRDEGLYIYAMQ